jgi:thioredoxin 1
MNEDNGVQNITVDNFTEVTGKGVSLVDFWAPWCHPCRLQGPVLEKVADHVGEKAQIYKLNVDENQEVAMKYQITGIPTLLLFKDGEVVHQFYGLQQDSSALVSTIEGHVN